MALTRLLRALPRLARMPAPEMLALSYGGFILLGTLLLKLPVSVTRPITWMDAFFTSTSAVTVTGLAVLDTGSDFTLFGQAVILCLIQFGGLGLMTFAVLLLTALGVSVGLPQQVVLREELGQSSLKGLRRLAMLVFRIAIVCELAGVALLAIPFIRDLGVAQGLWSAVFHSVSAFNNAGFGLWPDSLVRYVGDPLVILPISALFIVGGIGFIVIGDIWRERRWRTLSLHSKLMLVGTLGLILWGWLTIAALEWTNPATLGPLSVEGKVLGAFFQGVSPRTAGFNSVDIAGLHDASVLVVILLMLVGGGSTSTAGGIKVTSFFVLLLTVTAFFKRRTTLHIYGRSIGFESVFRVMALTATSLLIVLTGIFIVSISHDGEIFDLIFEVASAFGTVGLTRGSTAELDTTGRLVIILIMFIGRVGPLTLGFLLATRVVPRVRYPEGQVFLG
ncbi:Ktr system potassium transporter B [Primorskyibacter flagellatus]|uniref:Ktr system potassium transporter B n=1 Tax=Primorskyibacter flagellatus TaxID=1387277 RepID=A0A917AAQ9_9RHOB|nr:TrkH family potassium uptake protein [Primorskyibacter flagellatus]GGE38543.1 Ktr system potassium transporter B [Primorskyibacter flagellatus]